MLLKNSKGKIWYGMHFYPGVAEYAEPGKKPFRVFLNEDTIRSMGPTFAGRPVFVQHVDGVDDDVNELRKLADGWVVESFFNEADGKHWVKFITVSEKADRAIELGMRLSNCYVPKNYGGGGLWNGVTYSKEIKAGEYEHLAIVSNPRYEESKILSPEEFKAYNESKLLELKRLANHNDDGDDGMKVQFFKRAKAEGVDLSTLVALPKSKREVSLETLVNEMDAAEVAKSKPRMVNEIDTVEVDGETMTIAELIEAHQSVCNELEALKNGDDDYGDKKKENADDEDDDKKKDMKKENADDDDDGDMDMDDDDMKNEDDEDKPAPKAKMKDSKDKKKNSQDELERRRVAKEKADRVRNAHKRVVNDNGPTVEMPQHQVARGQQRYGSGK